VSTSELDLPNALLSLTFRSYKLRFPTNWQYSHSTSKGLPLIIEARCSFGTNHQEEHLFQQSMLTMKTWLINGSQEVSKKQRISECLWIQPLIMYSLISSIWK